SRNPHRPASLPCIATASCLPHGPEYSCALQHPDSAGLVTERSRAERETTTPTPSVAAQFLGFLPAFSADNSRRLASGYPIALRTSPASCCCHACRCMQQCSASNCAASVDCLSCRQIRIEGLACRATGSPPEAP